MPTKSGSFWVTWADTHANVSRNVEDLAEPFRSKAKAFIKALQDAGAQVTVTTTRRSAKRAYLFHWSWLVALGKSSAAEADRHPMPGVDIRWDHADDAASKAGAAQMVSGFGLAVPPKSTNAPSLTSNHIEGTAIDMAITWTGTIQVKKPDGTSVAIPFMTDVNRNTLLHAVGADYGVRKLVTDAPHWSERGN